MREAVRHRGEDGAYLIIYAMLTVGIFTIAALVLDITALRQDRKTSRFAADAAATAGAASLDGTVPGAVAACTQAWGYFVANRPDTSANLSPPDCNAAFPDVCDTTTARTATGTTDTFHVEITNPVPDGHALMHSEVQGGDQPQTAVPEHDGTDPCKRIGVRVERTRDLSLAGVAGLRSARTDVHSVAVNTTAVPANQLVALVVLDPVGCGALRTVDGGKLATTATTGTGAIYVDSTGESCGILEHVIDPANSSQDKISADGGIRSHTLVANPLNAFDPTDVILDRLSPAPQPNPGPVGRAAIDARYGPVVASLEATYGAGDGGLPTYPAAGELCTVPSGTHTFVEGDRYVDCPVLVVQVGASLTFSSERIVLRGGVRVESGGCFAVNSDHCGQPAGARNGFVFVQGGDIVKQERAGLALDRTFVYLGPGGSLSVDGGTRAGNALLWRAPFTGALENLLFWGETDQRVRIEGQREFQMEGIFFAPGSGGNGEVRLVPIANMPDSVMQLIANRLVVDGSRGGQATFVVGPDPFRVVQAPTSTVRLIR